MLLPVPIVVQEVVVVVDSVVDEVADVEVDVADEAALTVEDEEVDVVDSADVEVAVVEARTVVVSGTSKARNRLSKSLDMLQVWHGRYILLRKHTWSLHILLRKFLVGRWLCGLWALELLSSDMWALRS